MAAVLLALAAALSWGISDFLGGLNSRRVALGAVVLISQTVGLLMLMPIALLHAPPNLDQASVVFAAAGSVSGLVGIGGLYRGMSLGSVSIVAPISATGAAVPVIFGLVRGEQATLLQSVGIALTLVGVILASRSPSERNDDEGKTRPLLAAGVGFALLAALGFGGFFVLLHEASAHDVLWAAVIQRLTGVVVVGLICLVLRPSFKVGRRLPSLAIVGVLDTGANVLYAFASTVGLVSLAAVLASLFPVVTVILARFVLHERLVRSQAGGIVCALAGVACIATH